MRTTGGAQGGQEAHRIVDVFKDLTQQQRVPFLLRNLVRKRGRQIGCDEIGVALVLTDGGNGLVIEIDAYATAGSLGDTSM